MENLLGSLMSPGASSGVGSNISFYITVFVALFVVFGFAFGFKRGFSRSVVRIALVIVSAVVAFIIASGVSGAVTASLQDTTIPELWDTLSPTLSSVSPGIEDMMSDDVRALLNEFDPETSNHIIALLISLFCIPFIFVGVFYAIKCVSMILYWIVTAMLGLSKKRTKFTSRLFGCVVGAAQGALIATILILPLSGITAVASECREVLTAEDLPDEKANNAEEFFAEYVDAVIANPIIAGVRTFGGNAIFDRMTAMTFGDNNISTEDELVTFVTIYTKIDLLGDIDWDYPTEEHKKALEDISDLIGDDYYTSTVISGILRGFSRAVNDEIIVLNLEKPMDSFVESIVKVFNDSSRYNLGGDIDTVLHIYFILADNDVLVNFYDDDNLRDALLADHADGKNVIDYIVDELYLNPRTAGVVNALTEISVKIMCEELNLSEDATVIYTNIKNDVGNILLMNESDFESPEEYKAAVTDELKTTLENNNISIDDEIVESMSEFITENYGNITEEITDQDINKAILSYYRSYAEENPGTEIPDEIPDDLKDVIGDILGNETEN